MHKTWRTNFTEEGYVDVFERFAQKISLDACYWTSVRSHWENIGRFFFLSNKLAKKKKRTNKQVTEHFLTRHQNINFTPPKSLLLWIVLEANISIPLPFQWVQIGLTKNTCNEMTSNNKGNWKIVPVPPRIASIYHHLVLLCEGIASEYFPHVGGVPYNIETEEKIGMQSVRKVRQIRWW